MPQDLADQIATRETKIQSSRYHRELFRMTAHLLPAEGVVLDLGCGYGGHALRLSTGTRKVVGVDLRRDYPSVGTAGRPVTAAADATSLPFRDAAFDALYSLDLLEHVRDDRSMILECLRVLRPGGRAVVETPNVDRLSVRLMKLAGRKMEFPRNYGNDPALGPIVHEREYSATELEELFRSTGFEDVLVSGLWLGLTMPELGLRRVPRGLRSLSQSFIVLATKPV